MKRVDDACKDIIKKESLESALKKEKLYLNNKNKTNIIDLYENFETVWNNPSKFNPSSMREAKGYNLFTRYYSGSYFGIQQSIEIDAIVKAIHSEDVDFRDTLFACLFYAMKETVYSRDGHMAQPLSFHNNAIRGFNTRATVSYTHLRAHET